MEEYFEQGHAEPVSTSDIDKPASQTFYLPMHAVQKETSTTTKYGQYLMHLQPLRVESLSMTC